MPASGLLWVGLARFGGRQGFFPGASFRFAGRERRHVSQARHEEQPKEQDYFLSRVQAAGRLPERVRKVTRRHRRCRCRIQRLKWKAARRPAAGGPAPQNPKAFGSASGRWSLAGRRAPAPFRVWLDG